MRSNKFQLSLVALAVLGMHIPTALAADKDKDIEVTKQANSAAASKNDVAQTEIKQPTTPADEHIVVTGSRLQYGDVTAHTIVIDEMEIKRRGVTSVTELMRTIPQNLATIGDITNNRSSGPLGSDNGFSDISSLGVSAANFGGLGAGKTLVLVNGRRLAGAAGMEDGFVNLNGIPLSAVERVEIDFTGSSAVYGADAMGGVVNFILKQDFIGTTVTARHEYSSNDADNSTVSLFSGYNWSSGSLSGTVEYRKSSPVNNWKSGWTTMNYSDYYNGDSNYDFRSYSAGAQPGVIDTSTSIYDYETGSYQNTLQALTLPAGFSGQPGIDDFVTVGDEYLRDPVPETSGPETDSLSATLNFDQRLTEKLNLHIDGLYSRTKNEQEYYWINGLTVNLAPGQYYNPFPAYYFNSWNNYTTASYFPAAEISAGSLSAPNTRNTSTNWNMNLELSYEFNEDTKLDFTYSRSGSHASGSQWLLGSLVQSFIDDGNGGYSCYNYQLQGGYNTYSASQLSYLQSVFDAQCTALTSSDPDVAFNPWNSTNGGTDVSTFLYRNDTEDRGSALSNYELRLNGSMFELPAGKIYYAFGGEYQDNGVSSDEVKVKTGESVSSSHYALFLETNIPVFGNKFTIPGAQTLTFNLAARRDSYTTEGAVGTEVDLSDGASVEDTSYVYAKNTFARISPSIGFLWEPIANLNLRGKWTKGFKAPPFTKLFNLIGTSSYSTVIQDDPYYTCTDDCDYPYADNSYYAPLVSAPNADLKPETSIKQSYGIDWTPDGALRGLNLSVQYSNTKISNQYANFNELTNYLTSEERLSQSQFYIRDDSGKVVEVRNMTFNISGTKAESISYEASYVFDTSFGTITPKVTYLDNLKSEVKAFASSEPLSTLGTIMGVDDYKITASLMYDYGKLSATLWAYYTPSYVNNYLAYYYAGQNLSSDLTTDVDSMTTYDLTISYRLTSDLRINFAGRNILDTNPPLAVANGVPYDTARYNPAGRRLSLEVQYEF